MMTRCHIKKYISGTYLIELMIGVVLGVSLLSGLIFISGNTVAFSTHQLKAERLNYQMRAAMDLMTGDIRRAGYWGTSSTNAGTGTNDNPFMTSNTDLTINNTGDCILFTYDRNMSGIVSNWGGSSSNEHFGYRLSNGVLQGLASDSSYSCTSTSSNWKSITDSNTATVTALSFTANNSVVTIGSGPSTITIRYITVSMTANLVSDPSVTQTLTNSIRVRAIKYSPS